MVSFLHSTYDADEDSRGTIVLVFITNPSSTNTTVEVFNNDITAFGKYSSRLMDCFNNVTNMHCDRWRCRL